MKYLLTAVILGAALIYILTAPPTIYPGDGGELAAAAYKLGIGHPPGYPLLMLSGKIISFVPAGDSAFRMNLMSSLSAIIFLIFFYRACVYAAGRINSQEPGRPEKAAVLAVAAALIFSRMFWFDAVQLKGGVYVIEYLILAAAFYYSMKYYFERNDKYFFAGIYAAGFLPAAHHTGSMAMIFMIIMLMKTAGRKKPGFYAAAAGIFLVSFVTPYLYLFIRAGGAELRWADINTPYEVLRHIMRSVYFAESGPPFSVKALIFKTADYVRNILLNYNVLLMPALYGVYRLLRKDRPMALFILSFFVFNFGATAYLTGNDPSMLYRDVNGVFYLLNDIVVVFFAATGAAAAISLIRGGFPQAASAAALFIIPAVFIAVNWAHNDKSRHFIAYDHALNICRTIEPDGILFDRSDEAVFSLQYMREVKGLYKNLRLYDSNGNVLDTSYMKGIRTPAGFTREGQQAIELGLAAKFPGKVHYMEGIGYPEKKLHNRRYGMLYRLMEENEAPENPERLMLICSLRDYFNTRNRDMTCRNIIARYFISAAEYAAVSGDMARFKSYGDAALLEAGDYANVYKGLAFIYYRVFKDGKNCMKYLERSVALEPYDFAVVNLIIRIYLELGMNDLAMKWYEYYLKKEWDPLKKLRIMEEIKGLAGER